MVKHAMHYVQQAQNVQAELDTTYEGQHGIFEQLEEAKSALVKAESQLVQAYGQWRAAMRVAAALGNERAEHYVEESTWDLT